MPFPEPVSRQAFTWGNHSAAEFTNILEIFYTEVVHWRRNCFTVPFGKAGRELVCELSKLYTSGSALESIALKATTVLPILLLQKPQRASKAKEHASLS